MKNSNQKGSGPSEHIPAVMVLKVRNTILNLMSNGKLGPMRGWSMSEICEKISQTHGARQAKIAREIIIYDICGISEKINRKCSIETSIKKAA